MIDDSNCNLFYYKDSGKSSNDPSLIQWLKNLQADDGVISKVSFVGVCVWGGGGGGEVDSWIVHRCTVVFK